MPINKLQVTDRPLKDIRPYAKNLRKNKRAIVAVKRSIQEFGMRWPIIIDKNGEIVAGHTRYEAAKELGMTTLPTLIADDMTEEQIKAFRIADNRTSDFADWDVELLSAELADLTDTDLDWLELTDLGIDAVFSPGNEDDQGNLDEKTPQLVACPQCGHEFEYVKPHR